MKQPLQIFLMPLEPMFFAEEVENWHVKTKNKYQEFYSKEYEGDVWEVWGIKNGIAERIYFREEYEDVDS